MGIFKYLKERKKKKIFKDKLIKKRSQLESIYTFYEDPFHLYNQVNDNFIVSEIGNKYGIMTKNYDEFIKCQYDSVKILNNDRFIFKKNNLWGIGDFRKNIIIPPTYYHIKELESEDREKITGLYLVGTTLGVSTIYYPSSDTNFETKAMVDGICYHVENYGLINSDGKEILKPIYEHIYFKHIDKRIERLIARRANRQDDQFNYDIQSKTISILSGDILYNQNNNMTYCKNCGQIVNKLLDKDVSDLYKCPNCGHVFLYHKKDKLDN